MQYFQLKKQKIYQKWFYHYSKWKIIVHTDLNPQSQDSNLSFNSELNFHHNYQSSFDNATSDVITGASHRFFDVSIQLATECIFEIQEWLIR